ncbi:MAG TPA: hypothetical protein VGS19_39005 [Streptosporangiaceae bacterium]|nr:hypothetical protein [Streptosporangiaceae bacterium]
MTPRTAMAALVSACVLTAAVFLAFVLTATPPLTNLSAQVVNTGQVPLSFPDAGTLAKVLVHPGQSVSAHQVLATEVVPGLDQAVTGDRQAVAADHRTIALLRQLLQTLRNQASNTAANQQQQAGAQVSTDAGVISSTTASLQSGLASLRAAVASATHLLNSDEANFQSQCTGTAGSQPTCQTLAHQVAADKVSLADAQASLTAQQTRDQQWTANANRELADAQAAQQGLASNSASVLAPTEVQLANAQGQLTRDHAQLLTDESRAAAERILAPASGRVVSVTGTPGEVVSGTGVAGQGDSGGSVNVNPGFQMFPSQGATAGSASDSPILVMATTGPLLVNVVVPESQVGLVHLGQRVTVTPSVAGVAAIHGVVDEIFPSTIVAAGVVSYEVQVKADPTPQARRYLAGMTATASIGG